jgi:hypothetical protein
MLRRFQAIKSVKAHAVLPQSEFSSEFELVHRGYSMALKGDENGYNQTEARAY